jgi:hypothetical protein
MRLERSASLPGFDRPLPDLDLLIDVEHARHLEHEPGLRERPFNGAARLRVQLGRIVDDRDLAILVVAQRQVKPRLRPGEALPEPHGHRCAVD